MPAALLLTFALLLLTWLQGPVGAGILWDAINAVGFVALALFGVLHLDTPARGGATTADVPGAALARHTRLAYAALVLVALHAVAFLVYDPVLVEYLVPGAPAYMLAAYVAAAVLAAVVWSARLPWRRRLFGERVPFRPVHRVLAATLVVLSVWHVLGSGFYLDHVLQATACVALAATWVLAPRGTRALVERLGSAISWRAATAGLLVLVVLHSVARNF